MMTRTLGALLVLLLLSVACRKTRTPEDSRPLAKSHPEEHQRKEAITLDEALRIQQAMADKQNRAAPQQNAAPPDETKKRETAQEVGQQQRHAPGARRHRRQPRGSKALTAGHEIGVPAAAPGATAHVTLNFQNDAGATFQLVNARFVVDGAALPTVIRRADRGRGYVIFSGDLRSGPHTVAAHLTYQGANHRVFSYMNGYTFKVTSDELLTIRGQQAMSFTIICKERTGFNDAYDKSLVVIVEGRLAA